MTNLLFSILTVLVTNVSESVHPQSAYGIVLPMNPPIYPPPPPKTKSVHRTCERITNRVDTLTGTPITVELGRTLVWSTTENFTEVTEWRSSGVVTNDYSHVTNSLIVSTNGYAIQFNTNSWFRSESPIVTNLIYRSSNYTLELP